MSESIAVGYDNKEFKVGDKVTIVSRGGVGVHALPVYPAVGEVVTVTGIGGASWGGHGALVSIEGTAVRQASCRFNFHSRPPCCTLQEAADLLEAKGIQVDRKQLEHVLNPRPTTLPISKIRLRDTHGCTYIVTTFKPTCFQAINLVDHVRWNEGCQLSGGPSGICLNELENSVVARGLTLLDTWSENTEFPELLDKPELLES